MARGNDAEAAQADLEKRLGVALNAEAVIAASKAKFPQELRAASNKSINQAAVESLDDDSVLAAFADKGEVWRNADGSRAWTVRGQTVIALVDLGEGVTQKFALPLDDVKGGVKPAAEKPARRAPRKRAAAGSKS